MLLLVIPAIALILGFLGMRSSPRAYLLMAMVAVGICYLAYTR